MRIKFVRRMTAPAAFVIAALIAQSDATAQKLTMKIGTATINDTQHEWMKRFQKRMHAKAGDRIEVRRNRVYVNDEPLETIETSESFVDGAGHDLRIQREQLGDCDHAVLDDPRLPGRRKSALVVPPGRYFMMGDNRDHSNDSREWGTVRLEEMQGPAFILYWSWDVNGNFLKFLNPMNWWNAEKRWSRIFSRVRCLRPDESLADAGISPAMTAVRESVVAAPEGG